jgi:hypothetical protein
MKTEGKICQNVRVIIGLLNVISWVTCGSGRILNEEEVEPVFAVFVNSKGAQELIPRYRFLGSLGLQDCKGKGEGSMMMHDKSGD